MSDKAAVPYYDIVPNIGVGPIKFGMTREEVRAAIGADATPFRRAVINTMEQPLQDSFRDLGIFVEYNPLGKCVAVEFGGPAAPSFQGETFLGQPYSRVREWFRTKDSAVEEDDSGLTSLALGIGIYTPNARANPDRLVEGVIAFKDGYYEGVTDAV